MIPIDSIATCRRQFLKSIVHNFLEPKDEELEFDLMCTFDTLQKPIQMKKKGTYEMSFPLSRTSCTDAKKTAYSFQEWTDCPESQSKV